MIYIVTSIVCNTLLFVILKWFGRLGTDSLHGIVVNYFTAAALGFTSYSGPCSINAITGSPWLISALILGFLFISIFLLLAYTAQTAGVSVASVANKMSVVIPVTLAFICFSDIISAAKIAGVVFALAAVYLVTKKENAQVAGRKALILSFIVFFGSGIIDALVSYVSRKQLRPPEAPLFVSLCFAVAGTVGMIAVIMRGKKIRGRDLLGGVLLGIPNYFSIYTIIKAMDYTPSSVVYPVVNVSIVLLSALAGRVLFREKLSLLNGIGIVIAVIAIVMISSGI